MDSIFEVIIPLVLAAIYFFTNILSKKSGDDGAPPSTPGRVQDEIRRKVMELRRQAEQGVEEGDVPQAQVARPEDERRHELGSRPELHGEEPQFPARPMPPGITPGPDTGDLSWESSDNVFEQDMQASLQQIEATKRRAEALAKQAAAAHEKMEPSSPKRRRSAGLRINGSVRSTLNGPAAARAAFIYGEVLGAPISLKKNESILGLDR